MNYNISFEERAKLAREILYRQQPVTLEKARKQVKWLQEASRTNLKKQRA